jgi:hypothetical protein
MAGRIAHRHQPGGNHQHGRDVEQIWHTADRRGAGQAGVGHRNRLYAGWFEAALPDKRGLCQMSTAPGAKTQNRTKSDR